MVKIHSDLFKFWEHATEQRNLVISQGAQPYTWNFFQPLASLGTAEKFTSDELALLFSCKDDETFNEVLSFDEVHASDIANLQLYADKRDTLTRMVPVSQMNGQVGGADLTAEQMMKYMPFSVQLDVLLSAIVSSLERHAKASRLALEALHKTLTQSGHIKIGITLPDHASDTAEC